MNSAMGEHRLTELAKDLAEAEKVAEMHAGVRMALRAGLTLLAEYRELGKLYAALAPDEPTDAEVEAAARALYETPPVAVEGHPWSGIGPLQRQPWLRIARAALTAAAAVRAGQAVTA